MAGNRMASAQKLALPRDSTLVAMENISKTFGDVKALDDVSFYLRKGEIRALVGENGAGKSTLMNILYGMYHADSGRIQVWGEEVTVKWCPQMAISKGIGMIHQHFSLIPNLTVLENVVMPTLEWMDISPQWKSYEQQINKIIHDYGFQLCLKNRIDTLSLGEKQQVEILKALYQGAKILILDEPTGVLTPQQAENLLQFLVSLRERGYSVVLVTHKLNEAMAICDRVTVLRGGRHVATVEKEETTPQEIARMMVDREWLAKLENNAPPATVKPVLEVKELTIEDRHGRPVLDKISFSVGAGEIVGVAGVSGNGQTELAEALVGLRRGVKGSIIMDGSRIDGWSVGKRRYAGLGYIPEDRHGTGLVLELSVAENLVLDRIRQMPFSRLRIVQPQAIEKVAQEAIQAYAIKTPSAKTPIRNLSGGNQQKVVLARTLSANPKVVIACQPTWGLDFSATEYVRKKLIECAQAGIGCLLISSDLDELMELSHRIIVMFHGRIVGEFKRDEIDLDRLGLMMTGYAGENSNEPKRKEIV
ncbi:Xylose import ATP-binding protein XylG [Moorella thermoacetica]|uniref:Xylose import ATP-binding protein XylG n=1 Tax=Neomoorella thermoacetica TaxID=1525 RepID=A0AAC9HJV2_NEOTH|nr:ABC transporter ATP-binding protein [Moorella thermoacetica]AOQ25106.1 Xylose import ATP-binding protein XylG [Moorella thermoacetica]TYL15363.1 Xylose import ATP-binding protein XylG [Moorella thermoacetica]